MIKQLASLAVFWLVGHCVNDSFSSDEIPGAKQCQPVALVGGTIHTISGASIPNGTLVFDNGKITQVGKAAEVEVPPKSQRIDVTGKHVYPGLFDAYTNIGLVEINAVRATRDYSESGRLNPNVKANVAVNPDSELIPVTRSNGVLLALTAPTGGLIAGKSAVLQLDGWTYEDLTLKADVGMQVDWPNMSPVLQWSEEKSAKEQMKDRDESLARLQQIFDDARAYQRAKSSEQSGQAFDARLDALSPVLAGTLPLIVRADDLHQIQAAVAFAIKENVKLIILGGFDAPLCAELLAEHDVPVIVAAVYRLPRRRHEDYDAAYTLPERLRKAGIKFCISSSGRFGASNVRNLPYHAATAVAFGLPPNEALKAITLYPSQILGVANHVGSLDVDKDATLFIADGDILETPTNVEAAFVQGREVELNDKHKRLWRKYQAKQRQVEQKND
jgi:imidazolonepropionase-like amidohydrolase